MTSVDQSNSRPIDTPSESPTRTSPSSSSPNDTGETKKGSWKGWKVVRKMKRSKAKQWNLLDSGDDRARSQHKWIPLFHSEQKPKKWPKSSKRVVCLHVMPSRQEQATMEQFN